jgi:hypothetical protein
MRIFSLALLCLAACTLAGCFAVPSLKDPFGVYEAKVTMNDRNAEARETIARYDRDARMVEAEQAAEAKVNTARAWTGMIPNVVLLLVVGAIVVIYIQWNGRITLARIQRGELFAPPARHQVRGPTIEELTAIAARRNQHFKVVNGVALLIDKDTGEIVKRRSLEG